MTWIDAYNLLKKYDGDLSKASHSEIVDVIIKNNYNPNDALAEARKIFNKERELK